MDEFRFGKPETLSEKRDIPDLNHPSSNRRAPEWAF
jgi:hypothetical protein